MLEIIGREDPIGWDAVGGILQKFTDSLDESVRRVLLVPPDYTRKHSGAGLITALLYKLLRGREVHIMPALGTHSPMTEAEFIDMFGSDIPLSSLLTHNWRKDTVYIGTVPADFVAEVSEGWVSFPIDVSINHRILRGGYDLIISIGQVIPHEVVGMANYNKNIFVGCGGPDMINKSHFLGAAYGLERLLGRDHSPVSKVYDYAQAEFLQGIPIVYVLNVNSTELNPATGLTDLFGLFIGTTREVFEKAVALSQQRNITLVEEPFRECVVYLDEGEFKTTWLGCKAIYRTRMAMADGGRLVVIAPGLTRFGEDPIIDQLIRKYGYAGRENILRLAQANSDLRENLSAAAHLIHGSVDGRFEVVWACERISRAEMESVNFGYMPLREALAAYPIHEWQQRFVPTPAGDVYYISNPATGLWAAKQRWLEER